jgi:hypothetical protein
MKTFTEFITALLYLFAIIFLFGGAFVIYSEYIKGFVQIAIVVASSLFFATLSCGIALILERLWGGK